MQSKDSLLVQIKELEESLKKRNFSLSNSVKYMRAILDLQATIVFVLDKDEVIDGSQSYLYLFNYGTIDEMQRDFIEAYKIIDGKKYPSAELMYEKNWVEYLLRNGDDTHRIRVRKDGIEYIFEILARNMLYKSGVSDSEYKEHNYTVVSLNDITDLVLEMERSREKDYVLMRQSKFAALGEMIANITHQWKQPINSLGILIQNLEHKCVNDTLDKDKLIEITQKELAILQSMSKTVEDFANFFSPNKEKTLFSITESIRDALFILEPSFKQVAIEVELNVKSDCKCYSYKNEIVHALLNILQNARDVLLDKDVKKIIIEIECRDSMALCTIEDFGGGIGLDLVDKIFDPYFSTKDDGTGIGLYMTKMIIEDSLNGSITVSNTANGAKFSIMFPVSRRFYGA